MKGKALIAMSGGVDSSVAAWLMKKDGWDCIGATMKLYDLDDDDMEEERTCCSLNDAEDARQVAYKIGMPHYVFNYKDAFRQKVVNPFIDSYLNGRTPNPCIECNRHLKFAELYRRARELSCDVIVTGHYARILKGSDGYHLLKGVDRQKDQSYVLYPLTRDQLAHTRFPIGDYSKEEIRQIAEEQGFVNAGKKDSQDICFIPDGNYRRFIEESTGRASSPGDFTDRDGNIIGRHQGYYCYTIGQRRGLGISSSERIFVIDILPEENRVILGKNEDLMGQDLLAGDFNWIEMAEPEEIIKARIRYHHKEEEATAKILEDGRVAVHFLKPQRAITKGQSVVLYRGDHVVGGGTIL